jgi:hypothetical protein
MAIQTGKHVGQNEIFPVEIFPANHESQLAF